MNNTTGVFCNSTAVVLITFILCFSVSHCSPATFDGSKDVISNINITDASCLKLPSTPDQSVSYKCSGDFTENCTDGKTVPQHTVVKITCNPGYSSLKDNGNETVSVCIENKWTPARAKCHKTCDRLYSNHMNINLECFQANKSIPCEENSLIAGAKVRAYCKYAHRYENYKNKYQEITCGEDGKWDTALIPCIPGCEKNPESHFEAPWHVTILHNNADNVRGCSGTIISPWLILTLEFCVHLELSVENNFKGDANATHYSIIVTRFPKYQRLYEVAEFRYFNRSEFIHRINRSHTPMIAILKEKLDFNSLVSPAHIQWENPSKLDMWNGTVKVSSMKAQRSNKFSFSTFNNPFNPLPDLFIGRPTFHSVNFSSHVACKERPTYPYFAYFWGILSAHETAGIVEKSFLFDKNLMCLEYYERNLYYNVGSGVMVEENNCYFIRGIMGFETDIPRFFPELIDTDDDDNDTKKIVARFNCGKEVPLKFSNHTESVKFWCDVTSRMKANKIEPLNVPNIAGSIDIADYIGWIRKVRDEFDIQ